MKIDLDHVVELSHPMIPDNEHYYLRTRVKDVTDFLPEIKHEPDVWYILGEVEMSSHMGTHIEFPFHHKKDGLNAGNFPLDHLIAEATVMDFSHKKTDEWITLADVKQYKDKLKKGDMIFFFTGRDKNWRNDKWNEEVHLQEEAMDWLLTFDPVVVGTDETSFEVPGTEHQPNHSKLFEKGAGMIESACNLDKIKDDRVLVMILPLPIQGLDACPVRILALKEGALKNG
jgi:arylformamidase